MTPQKILISRTDKIGDVVLTLPLAGFLKKSLPGSKIAFLGQKYTRAIIESSAHVDEFHDWGQVTALPDALQLDYAKNHGFDAVIHVFPRPEIARWAARSQIPLRIGTTHRLYHLWTCNRWINVARRHSPLHEAQLNISLARPLVRDTTVDLKQIPELYGMQAPDTLPPEVATLLAADRFNLILHPKSKGSAREWPTEQFVALAKTLPQEKFRIFVTGGPDEVDLLAPYFPEGDPTWINLAGRLTLDELLAFIGRADGLVAASTGPLHLAAALGRHALGIYPPIEPMHAGRWGPLGLHATTVSIERRCETCREGGECACMSAIPLEGIRSVVTGWAVGR